MERRITLTKGFLLHGYVPQTNATGGRCVQQAIGGWMETDRFDTTLLVRKCAFSISQRRVQSFLGNKPNLGLWVSEEFSGKI